MYAWSRPLQLAGQSWWLHSPPPFSALALMTSAADDVALVPGRAQRDASSLAQPVSYTHQTLPTSDLV